jgi:tripartite-type tricarboxylate transporter receptor subunit TctC
MRMKTIASIALAALLNAAACAHAQDWPQRPVRMLVGFGPGGGTDIVARIVAQPLTELLGQAVVVENRPGAGGTVAAAQVAKAAPDGYAAFMLNNGFAVAAVMQKALPYDPLADFQAVSMVATMPLVVLTGQKSGFSDLAGLVAMAKASPGKFNFASVGVGSTQHFAGELLFQLAGIQLTHVPYKGTPAAIAATQTNEAHLLVEVGGTILGQVRGGALKALGVTSSAPFAGLPEVPTLAQAGLAGYDVTTWYALAFPAKTPAAIVERTNRALRAALAREEVRKQMSNAAFAPETSTPEALQAHVKAEIARWAAVRDKAGVKPE